MPTMYRSPFARYVLAVLGVTAGVVFVIGDPHKWQSAPSLHFLSLVPILPLDAWGYLSIAYGLLLLPAPTRAVGYAIGAFLFAVMSVCLISTINTAGPKNIWAVTGVIDAMIYHVLAIRLALVDRVLR